MASRKLSSFLKGTTDKQAKKTVRFEEGEQTPSQSLEYFEAATQYLRETDEERGPTLRTLLRDDPNFVDEPLTNLNDALVPVSTNPPFTYSSSGERLITRDRSAVGYPAFTYPAGLPTIDLNDAKVSGRYDSPFTYSTGAPLTNRTRLRPTQSTSSEAPPARKKLVLKLGKKMSRASPAPAAAAPTDVDGDTIAVRQKLKTVEISDNVDDESDDDSPLSDLDELGRQADEGNEEHVTSGANQPLPNKGKAPVREYAGGDGAADDDDHEMVNADEAEDDEDVDEGSVDYNEPSDDDDDNEDDDDDKQSIISIDSKEDEDQGKPFDLLVRPWKAVGFSQRQRHQWETMYCTVEMQAIDKNWDFTEAYQHEKDKEMLRYMEDFALPTWVIPKEQAEQAYFRLLERSRWRTLGIRIYGNQRIPEIIPNATPYNRVGQFPQQQMPLNIHPGQYPQQGPPQQGPPQHYQQRQQSMGGSRPPSGPPQQQMQYRPPPQQHGMGMPPNMQQGMQPHGSPYGPPPPGQTLRSQPHALPMNMPPGMPHPMQMGQGPHPMSGPPMMHGHQQMGHQQMSHAPHGLPYAVPPHLMSHANVPMQAPRPMPMQYGLPPGMNQMPTATTASRGPRKKKETPAPPTPPPAPPTPPYDGRPRPIPRKEFNKTGKRNMRKQAEALDFPWQRKMDFHKARAEAKWDDSGYDRDVLDGMAAAREKNMPIITKLDDELAEKQRMRLRAQRNKKKKGGPAVPQDEPSSDAEKAGSQQPEDGDNKKETKRKSENIGGDPYYSGNFSFATEADRQKALALQRRTPDDLIDDAEGGRIDWDLCKEIFICWNPGKKGLTQDLVQAQYRVYDTLITRKQLKTTPILTRRAAECIVDFCPDLLWRETLLRIVSEAGYGNKDVRDRFCYNGCHNDKATITKRIAAALGQKQQNVAKDKRNKADAKAAEGGEGGESADEAQPPPKKRSRRGPEASQAKKDRYQEGEEEWHAANKVDFNNYIRFFGKRPGARTYPATGDKRKMSEAADGSGMGGSEEMGTESPATKRAKSEVVEGESPVSASDGTEMEGDGDQEEAEEEVEDGQDAVSVQGSSVFGDSD